METACALATPGNVAWLLSAASATYGVLSNSGQIAQITALLGLHTTTSAITATTRTISRTVDRTVGRLLDAAPLELVGIVGVGVWYAYRIRPELDARDPLQRRKRTQLDRILVGTCAFTFALHAATRCLPRLLVGRTDWHKDVVRVQQDVVAKSTLHSVAVVVNDSPDTPLTVTGRQPPHYGSAWRSVLFSGDDTTTLAPNQVGAVTGGWASFGLASGVELCVHDECTTYPHGAVVLGSTLQ